MTAAPEERLIAVIARLIADPNVSKARHAAVGAASPIPAAACLLAQKQGHDLRLSLLHQRRGNAFTSGTQELFDLTAQGRIDLFFLGGGQIDGAANINLVGTGAWPGRGVRFPGSFGAPFMYMMVPRTILFREEHSRRVLVPKVDIVSAPGKSPPGVFRRGTAQALVTSRCVFRFDAAQGRFALESVHAGQTAESVREATGFDYSADATTPQTPEPTPADLELLRGPVCADMKATYPEFCRRLWAST